MLRLHRCVATTFAPGLALAVIAATSAQAAPPSAAQRCSAAKITAVGQEAGALLLCDARGGVAGADPACAASASAKRVAAFQAAEARGGCLTSGDSAALGNEVGALHGAVLAALRPGGPSASRCAAAQLASAGRTLRKLAQAYVRNARQPDPAKLSAQLASVLAQFLRAFDRAGAKGDCVAFPPASQISMLLTIDAARLRGKLEPSCGDDVQAGTEQCDGTDHVTCSGNCAADCTCAVPVCGNGIAEPGEVCDGADDAACDGSPCAADCTCASPVCGNNFTEPGEECDGSGCTSGDPGGCTMPGAINGCSCCASASPCYSRSGGTPTSPGFPCCTGVCEIPGPEAGPDVVVYCTQPTAVCPCWTTASLDARFATDYFDQNGRGGATCDPAGTVGIAANDTCFVERPIGSGEGFNLTRAGFAALLPGACVVYDDLDSENDGVCDGPPTITPTTNEQNAACVATLRASAVYQASCQ